MDLSINGARVLLEIENVPLLGSVQITQTLTASWLVMAIITGLCLWLGSGLTVTGISRAQALAEMTVTALVRFVRGTMGPEFDCYIPLIGTIFITSIVSNLISLLGVWSPTADLMTELAWAVVVFVQITRHKLRSAGLRGYLKGFLEPIPLMAPINLLSECFTPISMACRHFGNILSGTVISALVYGALTVASDTLFRALGTSPAAAAAVILLGTGVFLIGRKTGKAPIRIIGVIAAVPGVLAAVTGPRTPFPFLTVGIPAIPSLYFDWFSGCIQAFIFCTLTMIFIKQAAQG